MNALALALLTAPASGDPLNTSGSCEHWSIDPNTPRGDESYLPTRDPDPFYDQPDPMPCVPPGAILDSRPIVFTPVRGLAMPEYPAWHLKFLSTDRFGNPIAAVTTVVRPNDEPNDRRPLLAYLLAENSLGSICAPSHTFVGGDDNQVNELHASQYLPALIERGWALVLPDHEGPHSIYLAHVIGAHITLDAIRAAQSFDPLGLTEQTPVALWGFSGGSVPTAWAASVHRTYAPELNIVGVASGGTGVDIEAVLRATDGHPAFFRFGFAMAIGLARMFPDFFVSSLNAHGIEAARAMNNGCAAETSDGSPPPSGHFADYTTEDPWETEVAREAFEQTGLPQARLTPVTTVYIYHATGDELVPIEGVDALVEAWCADGAAVIYNRMPGTDHLSSQQTGWADTMRFLQSAFDGSQFVPLPTTETCNT